MKAGQLVQHIAEESVSLQCVIDSKSKVVASLSE
jgi:hypothetical protein